MLPGQLPYWPADAVLAWEQQFSQQVLNPALQLPPPLHAVGQVQ